MPLRRLICAIRQINVNPLTIARNADIDSNRGDHDPETDMRCMMVVCPPQMIVLVAVLPMVTVVAVLPSISVMRAAVMLSFAIVPIVRPVMASVVVVVPMRSVPAATVVVPVSGILVVIP